MQLGDSLLDVGDVDQVMELDLAFGACKSSLDFDLMKAKIDLDI